MATLFRACGAGLGDIRSITDLDTPLHFKLESISIKQLRFGENDSAI